ncbi:hypothetical protein ISR92_01110 [Patescibacteria group bacterium]|nr:hypothetical protein [Patescibacteria group bacterium]
MSETSNMEFESLAAPERLSKDEEKDIVEKINDERLRIDEDIEHFTIHIADRIVNIPKRKTIHIQNALGGVDNVKIIDYIKKVVAEYDSKS